MKKLFYIIFVLFFLLTPTLINASEFQTKSARSGEAVIIDENEVINRDYFITGSTVNIYGTVNGDLYVAGGQINIDGVVNGDLLVAGGMINISGKISQDVRVAGGQISINGEIGRNLTIAGGNIDIGSSAIVSGSLTGAGGNLNINAPIGGNINAGIGNLTISDEVGGDIEVGVGTLTLTPNSSIAGDLNYWSENDASISSQASVSGTISKKLPRKEISAKELEKATKEAKGVLKGISNVGRAFGFLSSLITGLIIIYLFPKYLQKTSDTISSKPLASLGAGLAALVLVPFLIIIILITIIGIPLALIIFALYLIHLYLAKIFVLLWIGNYVFERFGQKQKSALVFTIGLIIYSILLLIPGVSIVTRILVTLLGFGAMLLTCKSTYQEAKKKLLI